ncbi:nuclear transport factor 2 family protein [Nocardia wallacei]|uniref:nuclear transport factor 2 family protein n=1 Tax=Nocardia wallacei TaxID=480035 RepID=UPI0024567E94|nr:nuclear transport factor 2 family protein [Nocardia wallacei]
MNVLRTIAMIALPLALTVACSATDPADDSTRRQVQEAADREQITTLVYRLGAAFDEKRFDELHSILAADATTTTPGGQQAGRDAMIAQAIKIHSDMYRIQHIMSNIDIELNGDQAGVRLNAIAYFAPAGISPSPVAPAPQLTIGEVYRLEAKRTPDGWRLSRVQSTPIWETGTRPAM